MNAESELYKLLNRRLRRVFNLEKKGAKCSEKDKVLENFQKEIKKTFVVAYTNSNFNECCMNKTRNTIWLSIDGIVSQKCHRCSEDMLYLLLHDFDSIETEFRQLATRLNYSKLIYIANRKNLVIESTQVEPDLKVLLYPYFPVNALDEIILILRQDDICFKVENSISIGRGGFFSNGNQISIERTSNQIKFVDTFLHEYAHFLCCRKFPTGYNKNTKAWIVSHGNEWYEIYKDLVFLFLEKRLLPESTRQYYHDFFLHLKYKFRNLCDTREFRELKKHLREYCY